MKAVPLKVELIASTQFADKGQGNYWEKEIGPFDDFELDYHNDPASDGDYLAEYAGRACYESFHRPNPETQTNKDYLRKSIIESQHHSVLEHCSATLRVSGVSRALLLELERHRHLSFSVLSQRFVGPARYSHVLPPALRDAKAPLGDRLAYMLSKHYEECVRQYNEVYDILRADGLPYKQAREAARAFLPESTEVRMVLTGNVRAWRNIIALRTHPTADAEIREFCVEVQKILTQEFPNQMQQTTGWVHG